MSDSARPHRWQPTRLPRPWDSPGKNTGVGCHFLLQCMKVKSEKWKWSRSSCPTLSDAMDCSLPGSSVHGIFQARVLEWGTTAFSTIPAYTQIPPVFVYCSLVLKSSVIVDRLANFVNLFTAESSSNEIPLAKKQDGIGTNRSQRFLFLKEKETMWERERGKESLAHYPLKGQWPI